MNRMLAALVLLGLASCAPRATIVGGNQAVQDDFSRARQALDAGRYDEAAFGFADFIDQHPKSDLIDEAMYRRGQALSRAGRLEEAQTVLQEFLEKHPVSRFKDPAALELQLVQAKLAKNQEAAQALQRSVDEQRAREKAESTPRGEQLRAAARARESSGSSDEWDAALSQAPAAEVARLVAELDKRSPAWPAAALRLARIQLH